MLSSDTASGRIRRHRRTRLLLPILLALILLAALGAVGTALALVPDAVTGIGRTGSASPGTGSGSPGVSDGAVPAGTSVFDDVPAVTRLRPDLLQAVRDAARDAERDGTRFVVNSGWRSPALQERLFDDAVAEYGSRAEAARWVSTPATSLHVQGAAIDVGDWDAAAWLQEHGARYGLCQIYDNEAWHFELRPNSPQDGCPRKYWDPTDDPRMQR
ncbi:M15 family metallopeptidase [Curtobacterium sp. 9128]|uniref:M15 family metallopeptidase n=1 Tax=Curtobacterium sp. 9128 TaxID=1793722 RepID=UPI00119E7643|nr:M15 family metallopeptidase [Curtobacterium sp. 9128]